MLSLCRGVAFSPNWAHCSVWFFGNYRCSRPIEVVFRISADEMELYWETNQRIKLVVTVYRVSAGLS